jgi:uncharacterized protein
MAELRVEEGELVLHLSRLEQVESVHGDLRVPLSAVRGVEVLQDAHEPADHGFKMGTRLPGVAEVATVRSGGRKIFAAVHHDTPRGLRVLLEGSSYDEWIVGCVDPEAVKRQIGDP